MDEKTKVLIFERKEIVLIFLLMLALSICTFSLGVRIGKMMTFQSAGITSSDQGHVEMRSRREEQVSQVTEQAMEMQKQEMAKHQGKSEKQITGEQMKMEIDETYKNLQEEFNRISGESGMEVPKPMEMRAKAQDLPKVGMPKGQVKTMGQMPQKQMKMNMPATPAAKGPTRFAGKYTIQLGSYQIKDDAVKFAEGFRVRGYNPIIQEVTIKGKGLWYRVGLGMFSTLTKAKEYIEQEETLFKGQDYIITELR